MAVITKKCKTCGGSVFFMGEGILVERCTRCGARYQEPVFGPGGRDIDVGKISDAESRDYVNHLTDALRKKKVVDKKQ